jgi:pyruvate dehydrogenase E2 component (dihydrolipoamide acetyltransferase)
VRRDIEAFVAGDVEAFVAGGAGAQAAAAGAHGAGPQATRPQAGPAAAPAGQPAAGDTRIGLSPKRAVIARRLSESFFGAPHFYLKRRVEAERLLALRSALNAGREKPLSLNAFIVKLCAEAIRRHPYVNSTWAGDAIIQHGPIDIGLAVALPDGLITPVVRDCGSKGIAAIDAEFAALIEKARTKGLAPSEYEGAGFTVSNLGSYGVEEFTAIINPPGSAILAVGAALREAVVLEDGTIAARRLMALTLGCDHRVIDGAAGAQFLSTLASFFEEPGKALA